MAWSGGGDNPRRAVSRCGDSQRSNHAGRPLQGGILGGTITLPHYNPPPGTCNRMAAKSAVGCHRLRQCFPVPPAPPVLLSGATGSASASVGCHWLRQCFRRVPLAPPVLLSGATGSASASVGCHWLRQCFRICILSTLGPQGAPNTGKASATRRSCRQAASKPLHDDGQVVQGCGQDHKDRQIGASNTMLLCTLDPDGPGCRWPWARWPHPATPRRR